MTKRIHKDIKKILQHAYRQGQGTSRHEAKINPSINEQKLIFSDKSYSKHLTNLKEIANYAEENGCERISDLTDDVFIEFLKDKATVGGRDGKGAAKKTLQSYIGTYNKIQLIRGYHTLDSTLKYQKLEEMLSVRSDSRDVYKDLTADEWIKANPKDYEKYKDTIEVIEAFGLRRRELKDLNSYSFFVDKHNKIYVQTIGKGGKYRVSASTNALNDQMLARFKSYARNIDNVSCNKPTYLKSALNSVYLNLPYANSHMLPMHIFRAKYAQTKVQEQIEYYLTVREQLNLPLKGKYRGYSRLKSKDDLEGIDIQIGLFKGPAQAFIDVSRELGHNRLDVLIHYLK